MTTESIDKMGMFTLHKGGKRIGIGLCVNTETAAAKGKKEAEAFGDDTTFKVWECTEIRKE